MEWLIRRAWPAHGMCSISPGLLHEQRLTDVLLTSSSSAAQPLQVGASILSLRECNKEKRIEITRNVTKKGKAPDGLLFPSQCKIVQDLNETKDDILKTATPCPPLVTFLVATCSSDRKQLPP